MRKLQKTILGFLAPILVTGAGLVPDADAGVKVKATLRTPGVVVRVGHPSYTQYRTHKTKRFHVRRYQHFNVTRQDWRVAGRLASVTGVPTRELIEYRRYGYTWREIGRAFRLPRPMMHAAMDQRSWKRFLREAQIARHRDRPGDRRLVAHFDNGIYFDD